MRSDRASFARMAPLAGFAVLACAAVGQVGPQPLCNKAIGLSQSHTISLSGCSSYTNCDDGYTCIDGTEFRDCGPNILVEAFCQEYVGGWFNLETNQCEGGIANGPTTSDGWIFGYPQPTTCSGGNH